MSRGPLFGLYLGVVRKHWLLICVIGGLILTGGYLYHSRQVPVFEATAKLRIIRQSPRSKATEASFSFEEDQAFYATQYHLLRTKIEWADMALDRAAYRLLEGLAIDWEEDPETAGSAVGELLSSRLDRGQLERMGGPNTREHFRGLVPLEGGGDEKLSVAIRSVRDEFLSREWGLTADSLLGRVQAAPIPGTHLAELTLTAGDPGIAVFLVNLYAELYRDVSTEAREETLDEEVDRLRILLGDLKTKQDAAELELKKFREDHLELAIGEPVNHYREEADSIASRISGLETEQLLRKVDEDKLRSVLTSRGVAVVENPEGISLGMAAGSEGDLHALLAQDFAILDLDIVRASGNVKDIRGRIRNLESERARMPRDFTEESHQVQQWNRRMLDERRKLAIQVEATILRYLEQGSETERKIEQLRARYGEKDGKARDQTRDYADLERLKAARDSLAGEKKALDRGYESFRRLRGTEDAARVPLSIQNIRIERPARLQDARQTHPNSTLIFFLTGISALLLSLGSAFLVEFLDDTIKTRSDLDRLEEIPDIGHIPLISGREVENKDIAVHERPRSGVAEAFRTIRTGINFSKRDREIRSILLTSAGPGEGKTTVAVNLALTMAQAGRGKILLIDADLRKARVHTALEVENDIGLTNCLIGSTSLSETVRETRFENLHVLPAGPTPPNPAELLGGVRMTEILEQSVKEYRKVIIDTSPLVAVTDASLLSSLVDGVFLIISVGKTSWRLVQRGQEILDGVGVKPTGAVLNNIRFRRGGYGYGYGYGYGS